MRIINLEEGGPLADVAMKKLSVELRRAKAQNIKLVKLIHGWGSTGVGGVIKIKTHTTLRQYKKTRRIEDFLKGEDFSPFDKRARVFLDKFPKLKDDKDYGRENGGITIVTL